jgi:hypothetical protein
MAKVLTGKATQRQLKYLWAFEIRFGIHGKAQGDWFAANKDGRIDRNGASQMIDLCKKWENDKTDQGLIDTVAMRIREYSPDFAFKDADQIDKPATEKEVQTVVKEVLPNVTLDSDMTIDEVLLVLHPFLGDTNCEIIRFLWDARPVPEMPSFEVSDEYQKPEIFDVAATTLKTGKNLLVYGPAGCGKSRMAQELADTLGLEFFPFSVGGGMRYSQVFGGDKMMVDPESNQQVTDFVPSELLLAVQRPTLVLLDEIFGLDAEVSLGLNGLLESGTRSIMTKGGLIECHKDCVFIACANTNGRVADRQYTGAMRADASLRDRFVKKHMDYSLQVETNLLERCADGKIKGYLQDTLAELREQCKVANIMFDPSTRRLISAIDLANAGIPMEESFEMAFLEDLSKAERIKVGL